MDYYPEHYRQPSNLSGTYLVRSPDLAVINDIPVINNNRALHGDSVYYQIDQEGRATVIDIKTRREHKIPGVLLLTKTKIIKYTKKGIPILEFVPVDWRYPHFYVASSIKKKITSNHYILIRFKEWTIKQKNPHGICLDYIGSVSDMETEITVALLKNGLYFRTHKSDDRFKALIKTYYEEDNRIKFDNDNELVFSIDPQGCTDIDDAVHIKPLSGDQYQIGVHIADVDSAFPFGNFYESEIAKRMMSIYSKTRHYPMLPERFSSNVCSLVPQKVRKTISCLFTLLGDGNIVDKKFCLGEIKSHAALSYDKANDIIRSKSQSQLAHQLRLLCTVMGVDDSHVLIERLMILTNSFAAEFIEGMFIRVQESSGISPPQELSGYVRENRAEYAVKPEKTGHDLLKLEYYTHFTSPIRRYADLIVHRLVKDRLLGQEYQYSLLELESLAMMINSYGQNIKKFYRDQSLLNIYQMINANGGSLVTSGYFVDYRHNYVHIYIPELENGTEFKYQLCSQKILDAGIVTVGFDESVLTMVSKSNQESIRKYEKLEEVFLITDNNALRFQSKIKIRIPKLSWLIL
jgi:exoribonuclease R